MEEIAAGKGRRPKPFMLAGKAAASDAVWHSNRNGKQKQGIVPERASKANDKACGEANGSKMPQFIAPQLCKRVSRPPVGKDWVHEIKLDGYRMQLRVADGKAVMRTRKGLDWTEDFSAIAEAATGSRGLHSSTERWWRSITMARRISRRCKRRSRKDVQRI